MTIPVDNATVHASNVKRFEVPGKCAIEKIDWPYECVAKDKHPDHTVYACRTHSVWWHVAPGNVSLGVGHIWTNVDCPAYRTLDGTDCTCNGR